MRPDWKVLGLLSITLALGHGISRGETLRTQTLQLRRGWNAVYLEVSPTNSAPASVFAGTPVSIVASFFGSVTTVQFIRDPSAIGWKKEGWGVWYAPARPDSFLSTLHAVGGHQAYLVQASQDFTWNVQGRAELPRVAWKTDAFNFIGFQLDEASPPTFEKFFGGSAAHRSSRIFRLAGDHWSLVTNPTGTVMRAGEAFWIECRGSSDFQGPLRIKSPDGNRLSFAERIHSDLVFCNESRDPAAIQVANFGSGLSLPLVYSIKAITDTGAQEVDADLPPLYPFGTLEPGARMAFRLKVRRDQMSSPTGATLLKISNGAGAVVWLPVSAWRTDLSSASQ